MSRNFLVRTLLLALLFSVASCNDSSNDSDINQIVGYWYNTTDNNITSVRIDEAGTGDATFYTYSNTWTVRKKSLLYTIANDYLIMKMDGEDAISGNITITGKTLSFVNADDIYLFTRYNGDEAKIKTLQADIEKNYTNNNGGEGCEEDNNSTDNSGEENGGGDDNSGEVDEALPDNIVAEESFWQSEEDVLAVTAHTYIKLIEFTVKQLNLETIRITGKDLYGLPKIIRATSQEVEDCWQAAYSAINMCNLIIKYASDDYVSYINEARALRCFAYYNIAHLWGKAPYITEPTDSDATPSYTILDKEQIFDNILNEIDGIGELREINDIYSNYYIDNETLQTIKGEINLSRGDHNAALSLFTSGEPTFSLSLVGGTFEDYQAIFGNAIPLYTAQLTTLLKKEALGETEEALQLWQHQENATYGYWAMLKRTGKAQQVTGCKEHEILMPIPESEIRYNTNLTQNPGY
ncbi:MAG: RagB/SusD family nutrient uptake outer membrane protein [Bacteroidaceae bacterium]|nr:RagB/SusD family nutrient uptake outer membrane protein [Bacteroidaceae bacterium]